MFQSGTFVAEHVEEIRRQQIQPNGVDLTLEKVYEQRDSGRIGRNNKELGDRRQVESEQITEKSPKNYYLPEGGYIVQYAETVEIPEGHVGFIYPRSSLMRNSCMLNTAVWDAGYKGKGEGLLQVHHDIELERSARIAQLVLAEADHDETYDGDYQRENLE